MPPTRRTESPALAPPRFYFPPTNGKYEVKAGLSKLGTHEVHGIVETNVFMLDDTYPRFLATLRDVRRAGIHKRYAQAGLPAPLRTAMLSFAFARVAHEWPDHFEWDASAGTFTNRLAGWTGRVDVARGSLESLVRFDAPFASLVEGVEPLDAIDFLKANVPEDLSLAARDPNSGDEWLAMLHVCCVHHWDPRAKVGRPFAFVHQPVGGIAPLAATAPKMMRAVIEQGPYLRFAWGLTQSDRLTQHPEDPPDGDRTSGALVDGDLGARTFLRVERQTLWGFPEANGVLFTIRPYMYPLAQVVAVPERRALLASALRSMTPEQVAYKGMVETMAPMLAWLDGEREPARSLHPRPKDRAGKDSRIRIRTPARPPRAPPTRVRADAGA